LNAFSWLTLVNKQLSGKLTEKEYNHNYYIKNKDRNKEKMKKYHSEYYLENKDWLNEKSRKYNQEHKEQLHENSVRYRYNLRIKVIERFGSVCAKCGFNDWRALEVDHIHGGGTKERKAMPSQLVYYRMLLNLSDKELKGNYQLLCANCNVIKKCESNEYSKTHKTKVR
jgi:hypothetical protein